MNTFEYSRYVTGKNNIGRRQEAVILGNLLSQGEDIVIYEPPRSGKTSLIQQTLYNMKIEGKQYVVAQMDSWKSREDADFICDLADCILKIYGTTPLEFNALVQRHFEGTHFVFDPQVYTANGRILSLNWEMDENDIRAVLTLPYRIASAQRLIVLVEEFQTLLLCPSGEKIIRIWEDVLKTEEVKSKMSWIFCGSAFNAMKDIFERRRFFYRNVNHIVLSTPDSKEITDYVVKNFLTEGKVIDRELVSGVCHRLKGNLYYINHFCSICNSKTKGYIYEPLLEECLENLLAIHQPRFLAAVSDLTLFQLRLLKAIIQGEAKFSSAEIIRKYGLNSSANVRRLKDALEKKELVNFEGADEIPHIIDPLFEYWLEKYQFGK